MNEPSQSTGTPSPEEPKSQAGWHLSPDSFGKLLQFLDQDPERAGETYESVRTRLIRLFAWRGVGVPEDLADETINRVARKIDQGERILADDPYRYFCGVARLVFHEVVRREQRERLALEREVREQPPAAPPDDDEAERRRLDCLRWSISQLPENNQKLIMAYYQGEKAKKIENRRRLADHLGIPMNALRIRAHRIRVRLEASVLECLEKGI